MARRVRTHPVAAAAVAGAAAVVIRVVAAFAASGHDSPPPPPGAPSPGAASPRGSTAAAGVAAARVPDLTASYTMNRHVISCTPAASCTLGPLPLTIHCNGTSCTASSSHWASSHQLTFNGSSFSFTGIDTGVYGCDHDPSTIQMNLTVVSWSGSGATRQPQQLSGPYDVTAAATSACSAWNLQATLNSQ